MFMAILALIPGLSTLVTSITSAYFNAKVQLVSARIGGDTTVATKLVQGAAAADHETTTRLGIISTSKVMILILILFAFPIILWFNKIVSWDIVLSPLFTGHTGFTDPIKGEALDITKAVIYSIFGSGTVMAIGHMFFNRDKTGE
jgi:hypothetical protein